MKWMQAIGVVLAATALGLGVFLSTADAQRRVPNKGTAGGGARGSAGGRATSSEGQQRGTAGSPSRGTAGSPSRGTAGGRRDTDRNVEREGREEQNRGLSQVIQLRAEPNGRINLTLRLVRGGTFTMGDEEDYVEGGETNDIGASPAHEVTLTKDFYIGVTEVTQVQYSTVMDENPSKFYSAGNPAATHDRPVDSVTWPKAKEFCEKLLQIGDNARQVKSVRLPTEAEWEYSARAGTTTRWHFDPLVEPLSAYCWYAINSMGRTHDVQTRKASPWLFYDYYGNVFEWCNDIYDMYSAENQTDPKGPQDYPLEGDANKVRVIRGGSWDCGWIWCTSAARGWSHETFQGSRNPVNLFKHDMGFRIVAEVPE